MWRLQHGKDPEAKLFQSVMEFGHYGGRTVPTDTRQGIYCLTPSGKFLASANTHNIDAMAAMLEKALANWRAMPRAERLPADLTDRSQAQAGRIENRYPVGGLALRVVSRDLGREDQPSDWRGQAWNLDYAWFRKEETPLFVPSPAAPGAKVEIPESLIRRLARTAFVDNVRGQTPSFEPQHVKEARLTAVVESADGTTVRLRLTGHTRAVAGGDWSVRGFEDMHSPTPQERGVELDLIGHATWDTRERRFTKFEMIAAGTRWGATQYNGRGDDRAPAGVGFLLTLAGDTPAERVAPANFWSYGW